jgi:uncharacterized membrane protein
MKIINEYQGYLLKGFIIIRFIAYIISFLLISISIIRSIIIYFFDFINNINDLKSFMDIRLILGEAYALALSFILGVEILKIFYIKTYEQLVIVAVLVVIKLLLSYFLLKEIDDAKKNKLF